MKSFIVALVLLCSTSAYAQSSLALPTEGEQHAANVASYFTLGANVAMAIADCHNAGEWNKKCLIRVGAKNGITFVFSAGMKKLINKPRPCEPLHCGSDAGTSTDPSGHALFSFVNVDPFGQTHLGFSVEYSFSSATAAFRVLAWRHNWWNVLESAGEAQVINAIVHKAIK